MVKMRNAGLFFASSIACLSGMFFAPDVCRSQVRQTQVLAAVLADVCDDVRTPLAEQKISILMRHLDAVPISSGDAALLQRYILLPRPGAISPEKWAWVANDIMRLLCMQPKCPDGFVDVLYALYEDEARDPVLREYAVQHMGILHTPAPGRVTTLRKEVRLRLSVTLETVARDGKSRFCGAALNALSNANVSAAYNLRWGIKDPVPVPSIDIRAVACEVALDKSALAENRATALGICARLGEVRPLAEVRKVVRESREPVFFQMSGVYFLGECGDESDRELLQTVAEKGVFPLSHAAETALQRLSTTTGKKDSRPPPNGGGRLPLPRKDFSK